MLFLKNIKIKLKINDKNNNNNYLKIFLFHNKNNNLSPLFFPFSLSSSSPSFSPTPPSPTSSSSPSLSPSPPFPSPSSSPNFSPTPPPSSSFPSLSPAPTPPPPKPFHQIPGPPRLPLIGHGYLIPEMISRSKESLEISKNIFNISGDIYKLDLFSLKWVFVRNPQDIEKILKNQGPIPGRMSFPSWENWKKNNNITKGIIMEEGYQWKKLRKNIDKPMLKTSSLATYIYPINQVANEFLEKLKTFSMDTKNGAKIINIEEELFNWALESVGLVLYEKRFESLSNKKKNLPFINAVRNIFTTSGKLFFLPHFLNKLLLNKHVKLHDQSWKIVCDYTKEIILEKIKQIETLSKTGNEIQDGGFINHVVKTELNYKEILGSISEIMLGAVDTTSLTTLWTLLELSKNSDLQEEIYKRIEDHSFDFHSFHQFDQIPFIKNIIKESLRLYPIVSVYPRSLPQDIVISGYHIPKNTPLMISMFWVGRDERFFENPLKFDPGRWERKEKRINNQQINFPQQQKQQKAHPFSWLPFGLGPRSCVGRRIAELEMYILIFKIIKTFKIELLNTNEIKPQMSGLLNPSEPLKFKFTKRK